MSKRAAARPSITSGFRTFIILAMLFVGLALVITLQNQNQPSIILPTSEATFFRVFPELAVLDMDAIRLRAPETGAEWIIARGEDGEWIAPDEAPDPDGIIARSVARTIALLPYTRVVPFAGERAAYGFTPEGILSIEVLMNDGSGHIVAVGIRTTAATDYFAFIDERTELYLIDRAPIDFLIAILREQTAPA